MKAIKSVERPTVARKNMIIFTPRRIGSRCTSVSYVFLSYTLYVAVTLLQYSISTSENLASDGRQGACFRENECGHDRVHSSERFHAIRCV